MNAILSLQYLQSLTDCHHYEKGFKTKIMKSLLLVSCTLFCFFGNLNAKVSSTFDELKKLEGQWAGVLNKTNRTSMDFTLKYSVRSGGSAILEESNEGGIEMLTIYNVQNKRLHSSHYCALLNRPTSTLESNIEGVSSFQTDVKKSDLNALKDTYVDTWKHNLLPNKRDEFIYQFTVKGPQGNKFIATTVMT